MNEELARQAEEFESRGEKEAAAQLWLAFIQDASADAEPEELYRAASALGRLSHLEECTRGMQFLAYNESVPAVVRHAAAWALGVSGRVNEAVYIFLEIAHDVSLPAEVRTKAVRALGGMGHAYAFDALVEIAQDSKVDLVIRWEAARSLSYLLLPGSTGSKKRAHKLMVRQTEVNGILRVSGGRRVHTVVVKWSDDGSNVVYHCDCEGQKAARDQMCSHTLAVMYFFGEPLENELDAEKAIERVISQALTRHAAIEMRPLPGLHQDDLTRILWLADEAEALERLGNESRAIMAWQTLARYVVIDSEVLGRMAQAMERLGQAESAATTWLRVARNKDTDRATRQEAFSALERLNRTNELLMLAKVDEYLEPEIRLRLAESLAQRLERKEFGDLILTIANSVSPDSPTQLEAAQRLAQLDRVKDVISIIAGSGKQVETEQQAFQLAARISELLQSPNKSPLLEIAHQGKLETRLVACEVLGQAGYTQEAGNLLLTIARDEAIQQPAIRQAAVEALERFDCQDHLLILALNVNVEPVYRQAAVEALGRLGQIDPLLSLARDRRIESSVRLTASEALEKLGQSQEAIGIMMSLMIDFEVANWVRQDAAMRLGESAGQMSVEQGYELARFIVGLHPGWDSEHSVLQHLAWGMQKAEWSNPESATWILPLVEGMFEKQPVYQAVRDAAWEAMSQLVILAEKAHTSDVADEVL